MDPNGSKPPSAAIGTGLRYHGRLGMGLGMRFTLHGLSLPPAQFLPSTVPSRHSGQLTNTQITKTTTIVPNGADIVEL